MSDEVGETPRHSWICNGRISPSVCSLKRLSLCMSCGHVGCCDSSPNKHATAHWQQAQHPVMRSLERGEDWGWCYADEAEL